MKQHLLKATGLLTGVQTLGVVASIVRTKITALLIGTAGVGLVNYFSQGIALLSNTTGLGLSFSAVQRLGRLYERGQSATIETYVAVLRSWTLLIAFFGTLVCLLVGPLMSFSATGTFAQTTLWWWLSPAIGATTLLGTEMAILKGTHRLKALALSTGASTLTTLLITAGFYYYIGVEGVVPTLVSCLVAHLGLTLWLTCRQFPFRTAFCHRTFRTAGRYLIRLGVAYMGAGLIGSGADLLIATLLMRLGGVQTVGLYAAGFTLTVSYVRLIFSAVDADYFPRLSALIHDRMGAQQLANAQVVVLVALVSPCIIGLAGVLPWLVPLLYTDAFMAVVPMVACALLSMYFKAIYTPLAYYALARAESKIYFFMETLYYAVLVLAVVGGFMLGRKCFVLPHIGGLVGAGIGITIANFFDFCAIALFYGHRYGFRFEKKTLRFCVLQGLFVGSGLFASLFAGNIMCFLLPIGCAMLSALYGWQAVKQD